MSTYYTPPNVINYPFIDYIIKVYVPELQFESNNRRINMSLFREAMMHPSAAIYPEDKTYQRLEYLGDTVFHLAVTEYLYKRYDDQPEGFLTRLRIRIERGDSMVELAYCLELINYIQIRVRLNDHYIEDVFEAFIGAFYLNFGMKHSKTFIVNLIEKHKDLSAMIYYDDNYKDLLLRYFHQKKWGHPVYIEEKIGGNFISTIKNPYMKIIGTGKGNTKKKAEQLASKQALMKLKVIVNGVIDQDWMNKIDRVEEKEIVQLEKEIALDKKPLPLFNSTNKLITLTNIKEILTTYDISLPKSSKLNLKLFREATTHKSYVARKNKEITKTINTAKTKNIVAGQAKVKLQKKSNERLQFLGDAVIHFVIGEMLYGKYPQCDEGFLTRLRCKLENRDSLFYLAKRSGIDAYILVSQHIEMLHGRNNVNIIGGGFEAFNGALYLDVGLQLVRDLINSVIKYELKIDEIAASETNYKELVMQFFNKNHLGYPEYKVIREEGPDNAKIFTMGIYYKNKLYGQGTARSKKKASQIAAKKMYNGHLKDASKAAVILEI